jgi:membrane-associated phospholipid phosphatase
MCLLPLAGIFLLKLNGHVSDFDVTDEKERVFPYIITLVSSAAGILLIYRYNMPWIVLKLYIGSILATIIAFILTFKWKISVHTIAFGCLVASAFLMCLNQGKNPLLFFVILLIIAGLQATSRLYLKAHTTGQVTAGFFLGLLSVSATFLLLP